MSGGIEPLSTTPAWSPEDPLPPPPNEKGWRHLSTPEADLH